MDIMELGAIGELVGGLAVIGSLLYLGLQVRQGDEQARQSNAIERAQATRDTTRDFNSIVLALGDPTLNQVFRRGITQFDELPGGDQAIFHQVLTAFVVHTTSAFLIGRDQLMDEHYSDVWVEALASLVGSPGVRSWWDRTKPFYHADLVSQVDSAVSSRQGHPPIHVIFPWFSPDGVKAEA